MSLTALPATADNCILMIDAGTRAIVVDPGAPGRWPQPSWPGGSQWRRF